jgi:hypothetical protein
MANVRLALRGAEREDEEGPVWAQHVPAVIAFLTVSTQWRTALFGALGEIRTVYVGLDYAAAKAGLEAAGIEINPQLWGELRIMEAAAIAAMNGG